MTVVAPVRYLIARPSEPLPPAVGLYDYVLAAGGLYLRARRPGLQVCLLIGGCQVRGLADVEPELALTLPCVPETLTGRMLEMAQAERDAGGRPIEVMYHLTWADGWSLEKPRQIQSSSAVHPVGPFAGTSYETYLIEAHSHHELAQHDFSATDAISEGTKFRLFALLSDIFAAPRLSLRLNVYGYRWDVPATLAFELPEEMADGSAGEVAEELPEGIADGSDGEVAEELPAAPDEQTLLEALGWM